MRITKLNLVLVFTLVLFSFACQQKAQMDVAQVRSEIEGVNANFVEAYNKGDAAGVAALYTEDATLMPPNSKIIKGRENVQNFWNGAMQMGIKEVVLTTVDLSGAGDLAYEIGNYLLTIQPEGQAATKDEGKYIVVWKKEADGTWKLHADIWNSSLPAPAQEVTQK